VKIKLFTFLIALIVFTLSPPSDSPDCKELALDMAYPLADSSSVKVSAYDFGEGDLKNSDGKQVPCPLDGIIAALSYFQEFIWLSSGFTLWIYP